jgi:hypothetical protein
VNDWVTVCHAVAISGRVTDFQTGKAIGGARITIETETAPLEFTNWLTLRAKQYGDRWEQIDERPDRTRTAGDGHFHFMDLPDGDYTLKAELPGSGSRYGTAQKSVVVTRNADGIMAVVDIRLPPTTIKGEITDKDNEKVLMAEVRIKGSGERVFSDADGRYLLTGLEASEEQERTLQVSAQGYQQVPPKNVLLDQAGVEKVVDFALDPLEVRKPPFPGPFK